MALSEVHCLIGQAACGRVAGQPVCAKCGMDERVVYPGQADREAAQERAELRYLRAHVKELEDRPPAPPPPPGTTKAVSQVFRDAPWAPEMVVLPSGKYLMGSPESELGRFGDEGPQHEVTIGYGLALGKYPVTFEEWDACVADGGTSHKPSDQGWGRGKRPVINVSRNDAQQYVAWLNQKLGIAADDPTRYRLPSEAEWEYACRAGTSTPFNTGSSVLSESDANIDFRGRFEFLLAGVKDGRTTPVGSFAPNAWGLHDMHGNVFEAVQDTYSESYSSEHPTDGGAYMARAKLGTPISVYRGGSWATSPQHAKSASRHATVSSAANNQIGFRLARELGE